MAVHHAVGISRQRNSGYRPSRVNIINQSIKTHFYSAICRNESEAHVAQGLHSRSLS